VRYPALDAPIQRGTVGTCLAARDNSGDEEHGRAYALARDEATRCLLNPTTSAS
jgi:hypothetical protein